MKELYIAALEELIAEDMDRTGCDWSTAYARNSDAALDRMRESLADRADEARQRAKEGLS